MDIIRLEQPLFALLALPLVGALVWAEILAARERRPLRLAARIVLVACFAVALSGPRGRGEGEPQIVFALDVSRSMGGSERLAATVEQALASGRVPVAGWTVFAGEAGALPVEDVPPGADILRDAALSLDPLRTDIGLGLRSALGSAAGGALTTVVLVSDGRDTEGGALSAAMECRSRGVPVHALAPIGGDDRDVRVESLASPASVEEGRPYSLTASVSSTQPERATVRLERDGRALASADIRLRPGVVERVVFSDTAQASGVLRYRAIVEAEAGPDAWAENDFAEAAIRVTGRPGILAIGDDPPLAALLADDAGRFAVKTAPPEDLSADWRGLERYAAVVLENVPRSRVSAAQERALLEYVRNGGGLLATGGPSAFAAGGWRDSDPLASLLPVRVEAAPEESALLVILLDASGSMAMDGARGVRRMELAREAVAAVLNELTAGDSVAVVAFRGEAEVAVAPKPAAERAAILDELARIDPSGPTAFEPPLLLGLDVISRSSAAVRIAVLISDGEPTLAYSMDELADLASRYTRLGARLFTVGTGDAIAGEAAALLEDLAARGGGEFRREPDFARLSAALGELFRRATGRHVREGPVPMLQPAPHEIASGLDQPPPLGAMNRTEIKPGSAAVFTSPGGEPALALVRRGAGSAAVFTGSLSEVWAGEFGGWPGRLRLFTQTLRAISAQAADSGVAVSVREENGRHRLAISLGREGLDLAVEFVDGHRSFASRAEQVGLGRYEAPLPDELGRAFVATVRHGDCILGLFPLARPLAAELLRTGVDLAALAEIAEAGGGRRLGAPEELAAELDLLRRMGERDLTHVFAAIILIMIALELVARLAAVRRGGTRP